MKRVLIVKITSMGDLIQFLPALTDATQAHPDIQFDWVADESFTDIPKLHPAIANVISLPYRRWKKNLKQAWFSKEISNFIKQLRRVQYDSVIDAQSNLKSGVVTLLTRGVKYGLDASSVREKGAQFAYHHRLKIDRKQNHAHRMRQLMAKSLNYPLPETPENYGIVLNTLPILNFSLPERFIVLTAIASRSEKLWPESYWQRLITMILPLGYDIVLPWYSDEEKSRALRLKAADPRVHLLPPALSLLEKASVLAKASASVSVDTGLAHMAAALNIPTIGLYGPNDPLLTGTAGPSQIHLAAKNPPCAPCVRMRCTYTGPSQHKPACMESILPEVVLRELTTLLA